MTNLIRTSIGVLVVLAAIEVRAQKSVEQIRQKAERGDAEAQVQLGDAYDAGKDVTRDVAQAIKWYRKAAEQGNAEAEYSLGGKYDRGDGVSQDYGEALKWYRKAAEKRTCHSPI